MFVLWLCLFLFSSLSDSQEGNSSVLFHFQLIVFLQTTVISSSPLIISVSLCFPHSLQVLRIFLRVTSSLFIFICFCLSVFACLSLPSSVIPSLPLESLYLSHSLSLGVSQRCSVFPKCLVTVADFISIHISMTLSVCVCVCVGICSCGRACMYVKRQQSVILRKILCLNSRHGHSTFYFLTRPFFFTSKFHHLHHLHIISIYFPACHCLLSHFVSPAPCCYIFSLC